MAHAWVHSSANTDKAYDPAVNPADKWRLWPVTRSRPLSPEPALPGALLGILFQLITLTRLDPGARDLIWQLAIAERSDPDPYFLVHLVSDDQPSFYQTDMCKTLCCKATSQVGYCRTGKSSFTSQGKHTPLIYLKTRILWILIWLALCCESSPDKMADH